MTDKPQPDQNAEHHLHLLKEMLRIRKLEEKCVELYSAARIRGFLHLYIGEEAVAVGVMQSLTPEDAVVATYREHGHALARGVSANAIMAEMYGKQEGCSRGRGGSMHLFDAKTNFYGGSAIVGGGLPLAVGVALADKMLQRSAATICFFGDGASAEGEFYESMNLAALWKLPLLFVCENNLYAMGTRLDIAQANTNISGKAVACGINSSTVDGMDVLAVESAARAAVDLIKAGSGPQFLECRTYRFRAHSMYDPELYRSKEEVEKWKQRDPIANLASQLKESGALDDPVYSAMEREVDEEILAAVAFSEAGTLEPIEELERFVYSERKP
jgi:pyruvate dehydrogenase E1 component alpha subunit